MGEDRIGVTVNQMSRDPLGDALAREKERIRLRRDSLYQGTSVRDAKLAKQFSGRRYAHLLLPRLFSSRMQQPGEISIPYSQNGKLNQLRHRNPKDATPPT